MSTQPPLHRRALPVPVETTRKSYRVPVTSNNDAVTADGTRDEKDTYQQPAIRIEHNSVTNVNDATDEDETPRSTPVKRPLPLPIETVYYTNRSSKPHHQQTSSSGSSTPTTGTGPQTPTFMSSTSLDQLASRNDSATTIVAHRVNTTLSPPKYPPQLIETTYRTRRAQDLGPATKPVDKTDITPGTPHIYSSQRRSKGRGVAAVGVNDPNLLHPIDVRSASLPPPLRPYRQGSMRPHPNTRMNTRAGSYDTRAHCMPTTTPDSGMVGEKGEMRWEERLWTPPPEDASSPSPGAGGSFSSNDADHSTSTPSLTLSSSSYDSSSVNNSQSSQQHTYHEPPASVRRIRESCDERYNGYLLSLAAVAAETQLEALKQRELQEAVSEAFPNRDFCHEPVSHWGGDESNITSPVVSGVNSPDGSSDDSDSDFEGPPGLLPHEMVGRKESEPVLSRGGAVKTPLLTLKQLQERDKDRAHELDIFGGVPVGGMSEDEVLANEERLAQLRAEDTARRLAAEANTPSFKDPFWTNGVSKPQNGFFDASVLTAAANAAGNSPSPSPGQAGGGLSGKELKAMRAAAAPPMLGDDLVFRRCPSPKWTKFETDQRHEVPIPRDSKGGGLWGGYCVGDKEDDDLCHSPKAVRPQRVALLEMPALEYSDPFASFSSDSGFGGSETRNSSVESKSGLHMLSDIDAKVQEEVKAKRRGEAIEREFDDGFVTQVYNYLSLGWPQLARWYDEELSHISGVSVEELQRDDQDGTKAGNIGVKRGGTGHSGWGVERVGDNSGEAKGESHEDKPRWRALKKYVRVWARQHSNFEGDHGGDWGVRERRGSWAI